MKKPWHNLTAAGLAVVLAGCIAAWVYTRDANAVRSSKQPRTAPAQVSAVDQRLLDTARRLAPLAASAAEQELALEAVRLSDKELDLAFATAIREAAAIAAPASGPLHDLAAHIAELKARIAAGQQRVAQLSKQADSNSTAGDKLELAKAQLALDQDELDDAQQDLARQGGDEHAKIEHALEEHEAAQHNAPPLPKLSAAGAPGTLRAQLGWWLAAGARADQITAARQDAGRKADTLEREHQALEGKLGSQPPAPSDADSGDEEDPAAVVAVLRSLSDQRKTLADLDKRSQSCQRISAVYQGWLGLVAVERRTALHALLGSLAAILAVLLAGVVANRAVQHAFSRQPDPRRLHQLHVISRIAVQLVAGVTILLIIFGAPTQTPTILGLATAGLTIVLKDFIVAFFGWFVLMGRNGIRLGDWVEIEGVGGEVIEIGVLRTVLLEMGNWTNTGHPTGRRVGFVNSFAIEGHYFNFSTAGQWLWDELQVTLAPGGDAYRMAEQIRQVVEQETDADAKLAEQDWERVTHQYGTRAFSAKPAVDLRPSVNGLLVVVRYITRAPLRYEVKSRLFQVIVELMHKTAATV